MNTGFLRGNGGERDQFENLGVVGTIILKWVLRRSFGTAWIGFI